MTLELAIINKKKTKLLFHYSHIKAGGFASGGGAAGKFGKKFGKKGGFVKTGAAGYNKKFGKVNDNVLH